MHAQSLWIRLLSVVDDFGRYDGRPAVLSGECFSVWNELHPEDVVNPLRIAALSCELQAAKLAEFYVSEGKSVVQLLQWQERARSEKSKWPDRGSNPLRNPAESCGILPPSPLALAIASTPSISTHTLPQATPLAPALPSKASPELGKSVCVELKKLIPDKRARTNGDGSGSVDLTQRLNGLYHRPESDPWTYEEQHLCATIARRPNWSVEWDTLLKFRRSLREKRWFPQSITALLGGWTAQLDKARLAERNPSMRGE